MKRPSILEIMYESLICPTAGRYLGECGGFHLRNQPDLAEEPYAGSLTARLRCVVLEAKEGL